MRRAVAFHSLVVALAAAATAHACPFCNVDGEATRGFLLAVFGFALFGAMLVMVWSIAIGQFRDVEAPKRRMLELDAATSVAIDGDTVAEVTADG